MKRLMLMLVLVLGMSQPSMVSAGLKPCGMLIEYEWEVCYPISCRMAEPPVSERPSVDDDDAAAKVTVIYTYTVGCGDEDSVGMSCTGYSESFCAGG